MKVPVTFFVVLSIFFGTAQAQEVQKTSVGRSPWGYDLPLPFHQLNKGDQKYLLKQESLPLGAIGAVKVQSPPFRATAFYLGKFNGLYLFATSAHVVILNDKQKPYAVELGHLNETSKFSVPVEEKPLFANLNGDMAILQAKTNLSADLKRRLNAITPAALSFSSVATMMAKYPDARFYIAGRGKFAHARADQDNPDQVGLWTQDSILMWKNAENEANSNKDDFSHQGDVFAVARSAPYSNGMERTLRDPDGLKVGQDDGDPFLSAPVTLAPSVVAVRSRIIGRMSGSPLMMSYRDGVKNKTVVLALAYTTGIPENLWSPNSTILREMRSRPARAFGEVVVAEKEVNGVKVPFLSLKQTAPFGYMSTVADGNRDLQLLITDTPSVISDEERKALKMLSESAQ